MTLALHSRVTLGTGGDKVAQLHRLEAMPA